MNDTFYFFSGQDINFLKSELLLVVAWLIAFCGLLLPKKNIFLFVSSFCSIAILANLMLLIFSLGKIEPDTTTFFWNDLFYQNRFTNYLKILISVCALFSIWIQNSYNKKNSKTVSEWFVILLGGILSAQFLLISATIFGIYVSLELLSICGYLLVAFYDKEIKNKKNSVNQKGKLIASSFNYLVFGAVSSACLLYGFSWWYGISGSFSIPVIFDFVSSNSFIESNQTTFLIGFLLIGIGFLFKLAAVPLHFWISEVYKNTSSGTVFFLATIPKIAVTGILFFILNHSIHLPSNLQEIVFSVLSILGVLSALFGGFLAIQQTNFKCFFAYSGVSQIGFLMLLLVYNFQNSIISTNGILIFWIFYVLSNAIIWKFGAELDKDNADLSIKDLKNLSFISKIILSLASLSLAGLPPLGGFLVKMIVLFVAYQNYNFHSENSIYLFSLIGIGIATLIGFFYYLKIPYYLFLKPSVGTQAMARNRFSKLTLCCSILLILINIVLTIYGIRFL
ncbi:NADH:ubiquinone oxidoreductase subunit 2 (chain N) [Bernardetia litoralis DSM 6794]|uniref:NADH:ubiquinone oxidoreductase subunit 2 (Chain N) n=1 Tax=Bernardetia litoralis (strain ATCC 23117 / DSM 6794 / NBRC 15988 / NCIMB 1366 / Fx l1 / Sio-4) TaxID=880071 RepID=I4AGJ5_BERLS|nr:proton-conducting transporter membrane subunit [Bernardetia litoralis]AFM03080.1 NADH:ubiquinone oxidoreductase subunit 2 (chain N) [Bernardetia litoralis DSM 6794]